MTSDWLYVPHPAAAPTHRLVCLPHAGGGPNFYRRWGPSLGASVELQIVHYPGRETRLDEPLIDDPGRLSERIAGELARTERPGVATLLFGHSMGALLAHRVACVFPVARLILSACGPPDPAPDGPRPVSRTDAELLAALREQGGTSEAVLADRDLMEMLLPILRNDYLLVDRARATAAPPVAVPVTAVGGDTDVSAAPAQIAGWEQLTTGGFEQFTLPGGHFYLMERQEEFLELLRARARPAADTAVPPSPR
ncbi:thioesterase II family protein [Streptomyces xiamenensis]